MKRIYRSFASFLLIFAVILTMAPLKIQAAEPSSTVMLYNEGTFHEAETRKVLELVNQERAKVGLDPLEMAADLEVVAEQRAAEIFAYFDHTRPDGRPCFTAASDIGFSYAWAGENIAWGQRNANEVMNSWMNSEGHKANILNGNFTHIGIGCFEYDGIRYWVQFFAGTNSDPKPAPETGEDNQKGGFMYYLNVNTVQGCIMEFVEPEVSQKLGGNSVDFDLMLYQPGKFLGLALPLFDLLDVSVSGTGSITLDAENAEILTGETGNTGDAVLTVKAGNLSASKTIHVTCDHPESKYKTETKEATCTETGTRVTKCGLCGTVISEETLPKTEHSFVWTTEKEATCTEDGIEKGICDVCKTEETRVIEATGHTEKEIVAKEPTCTETGLKEIVCSKCGEKLSEEVIQALGHSFGEWTTVIDPQWETEGLEKRICSVCNYEEERVIPALSNGHEHDFSGAETVISEATCTKDGVKEVACINPLCSAVEKVTLPATGHKWSEWIVDVSATWDTAGSQSRTCSVCQEKEEEIIPALSETHQHDFSGEETILKEPTCTEAGMKEVACTTPQCGDVQKVEIPALGHTPGEWTVTKEATCTEEGMSIQKCTVCGEQIGEKILAKTEHNYGDWEVLKNATTTSEGERQRICADCGYVQKETIAKLPVPELPEAGKGTGTTTGSQIGTAASAQNGNTASAVKTGDNSVVWLYAVLGMTAAVAAGGVIIFRRKTNR